MRVKHAAITLEFAAVALLASIVPRSSSAADTPAQTQPTPVAPAAPSAAAPSTGTKPIEGKPKIPPMAPSMTVMDAAGGRGILGRAVKGADGKDMGRIVDVIVDTSGKVRAAVIDFGGFLGVGSRKIAVDWNALHFGRAVKRGDDVGLELTRDQLKAAPEYKEGKPLVVIGASGDLKSLGFSAPATQGK
ncbi:MAG TPA: PRC-barrel domain-containing protein [Pseudolabrys sp.]|nr:PRC-barrel domain-containing protein [Pseudolabrys sp.]